MFAGHFGAGLILRRRSPGLNLGALFFATLLLDLNKVSKLRYEFVAARCLCCRWTPTY